MNNISSVFVTLFKRYLEGDFSKSMMVAINNLGFSTSGQLHLTIFIFIPVLLDP